MNYTGYQTLYMPDNQLADFYNGKFTPQDFRENEYLIIVDVNGEPVDYFCWQNNNFRKVSYPVIGGNFTGTIKPRNPQQVCAMDMLKDGTVPIKLITGKFGSGKTLMCIVAAIEAIQKQQFEKIVFVRNNVQVKDTDQLGALPGDVDEKMLQYVMPFADHCGGIEGLKHLMGLAQLEVIPLGFLRGRSIRNAIIYSMESENLTKEHIQLIMGRVDEGSQLWMDGDVRQRDKASFEKSKGLETMIERLAGQRLFGYVHLIKSERSEVARLCDLLDD